MCGFIFFRKSRKQSLFKFSDQAVAFRLGMFLSVEAIDKVSPDTLLQVIVIGLIKFGRDYRPLGLADSLSEIVDGSANLFDFGVRELDRVNYGFLFHFLGAGLDHHDAVRGAYHHDVEQAVSHFAVGGIDDETAID